MITEKGNAQMVDREKQATHRFAIAQRRIGMSEVACQQIMQGDRLGIARITGIMGAKKTADLILLCRSLPLIDISLKFTHELAHTVCYQARVEICYKTGVSVEVSP